MIRGCIVGCLNNSRKIVYTALRFVVTAVESKGLELHVITSYSPYRLTLKLRAAVPLVRVLGKQAVVYMYDFELNVQIMHHSFVHFVARKRCHLSYV